MEKTIKRSDYYTCDRYGFAVYLISRLYNDLNINENLFKALKDEKYDSIKIYLFKITLSHLKESLKLFGKFKNSPYYKDFYDDVIKDSRNKKILDEIKYELENPKSYPDTVNARYLDVRNDIFHYGTEPDDFEEFKKIQTILASKSVDVKLNVIDNTYIGEIGVDFPKMYNIFDEESGKKVQQLLHKIFNLCRNILTNYYQKKF